MVCPVWFQLQLTLSFTVARQARPILEYCLIIFASSWTNFCFTFRKNLSLHTGCRNRKFQMTFLVADLLITSFRDFSRLPKFANSWYESRMLRRKQAKINMKISFLLKEYVEGFLNYTFLNGWSSTWPKIFFRFNDIWLSFDWVFRKSGFCAGLFFTIIKMTILIRIKINCYLDQKSPIHSKLFISFDLLWYRKFRVEWWL